MDYENSILYIKDLTKHGIKLGLERIREILKRLGNPQEQFRTIHIAGTNGKGSTVAMFDAIFRAAGYKTGRYTSPHLIAYQERFVLNHQQISREELADIVTKIRPVIESVAHDGFGNPTEFEVGTIIAFAYFAAQRVEFAFIEVGMGGRFDATNVIHPELCVITHIDIDHQEYLGDTLEKIAFEKAGIIKTGIPVVIGLQEPAIEKYLLDIAVERNAPYKLARELIYEGIKLSPNGSAFDVENSYFGTLPVTLGLIGEHQVFNCLNVLAGLSYLVPEAKQLNKSNVLKGLANTAWPGRLERIYSVRPIQLYLDGAHNLDGVRALVKSIKTIFPGQKAALLIGMLNNRPYREMGEILAEITDQVIITRVPDPKSVLPEELANIFLELGFEVVVESEPETALKRLLDSDHPLAIATGSLYLIGYLRKILTSK